MSQFETVVAPSMVSAKKPYNSPLLLERGLLAHLTFGVDPLGTLEDDCKTSGQGTCSGTFFMDEEEETREDAFK